MDDTADTSHDTYRLEDQVGFLMRRATQRHLGIFSRHIPELTATQFAALAKLCAHGEISQNHLGRETAMDAATIKGVIDRLRARGLVESAADATDSRRLLLRPSDKALALFRDLAERAHAVSEETLGPLNAAERTRFLALLRKLS